MVESKQQDIAINLQIKIIKIPVEEQMPVQVWWSRGTKKANTKKRLLSDQVPTAVFDEKFQINTAMELDEDNKPTKSKIVSSKFLNFMFSVNTYSRQ